MRGKFTMKKKILFVGAALALAFPIFAFADSNKDNDGVIEQQPNTNYEVQEQENYSGNYPHQNQNNNYEKDYRQDGANEVEGNVNDRENEYRNDYNNNDRSYESGNYYHPCHEFGGRGHGRHGVMRGYYGNDEMPRHRWDRNGGNYENNDENYNYGPGQHHRGGWGNGNWNRSN